ncbi:MAG: hypothetical protein AAFQ65_06435 [Myxococcota bacterium]
MDKEVQASLSNQGASITKGDVHGLPLGRFKGLRSIEFDSQFYLSLDGSGLHFEFREAFPNGRTVASDAFGNFWVYDTPSEYLFFVSHDPLAVVFRGRSLKGWLSRLAFDSGIADEVDASHTCASRAKGPLDRSSDTKDSYQFRFNGRDVGESLALRLDEQVARTSDVGVVLTITAAPQRSSWFKRFFDRT